MDWGRGRGQLCDVHFSLQDFSVTGLQLVFVGFCLALQRGTATTIN